MDILQSRDITKIFPQDIGLNSKNTPLKRDDFSYEFQRDQFQCLSSPREAELPNMLIETRLNQISLFPEK